MTPDPSFLLAEKPSGELRRELGLLSSTMIVVGSMVGSGIFIVSADNHPDRGFGWLPVKTRMFKTDSKESQVFVVEKDHLQSWNASPPSFGMLPVFALLISLVDERMMNLLIMPVAELKKSLPEVKHGYSIRFTPTKRSELMAKLFVDL